MKINHTSTEKECYRNGTRVSDSSDCQLRGSQGLLHRFLEWRHAENFPVYMGVSRGGLALHLSEHKGEPVGHPGAVQLQVENVLALYAELNGKKSNMEEKPIDQAWGSTELKLKDPFDNALTFTSPTPK
jgi:hypothetical protein